MPHVKFGKPTASAKHAITKHTFLPTRSISSNYEFPATLAKDAVCNQHLSGSCVYIPFPLPFPFCLWPWPFPPPFCSPFPLPLLPCPPLPHAPSPLTCPMPSHLSQHSFWPSLPIPCLLSLPCAHVCTSTCSACVFINACCLLCAFDNSYHDVLLPF